MYICKEYENQILKFIYQIRDFKFVDPTIKTYLHLHGSFDKCKTKYLSDVDIEYYLQRTVNPIENLFQLLDFFTKTNAKYYTFKSAISGLDDRFLFSYQIKKDGTVVNYNQKEISAQLKKLQKEKAITKAEYDILTSYLPTRPNLKSIAVFNKMIEDYQRIIWSEKELRLRKKIYRQREFDLNETLLSSKIPTILEMILEFEPNKYVNFDFSILIFHFKQQNNNSNLNNLNPRNVFNRIQIINDPTRYISNRHLYLGFFMNFYTGKYYKSLKRLRSILSSMIFQYPEELNQTPEKGRDRQYKELIFRTRREMLEIFDTNLGLMNQIKANLGIIIYFLDQTSNRNQNETMKINKLTIEALNDVMVLDDKEFINEVKTVRNDLASSAKKPKKEHLEELNKKVQDTMNQRALIHLRRIYQQVKETLPFTIPELE